ncbi:MAG TPA: Ig-like domain-containing protein [Candidatus Marinimicrobia bacterium]|nr:Ig-like domain-containing protein [Candidatus Neomarinimicrobiota bacterium]
MNKISSIVMLFVLVVVPRNSLAQNPPNWAVNPPDFQFNASMSGVLIFNDVESTDSTDIIAAFVGGECRGVKTDGLYFPPSGHWVFGLTIYGNTSGEVITFKAYDASADLVFELTGFIYKFIPNEIVGSAEDPVGWSFLSNYPVPPDSFNYISTPSSGLFRGQATVDSISAESGDWIAAFDEDGNCAGADTLWIISNISYINLNIYGDDMTSPDIDEGINGGEDFILRFWDSSQDVIYEYPESFDCWYNNNGAPMIGCGDINTIYNFEQGNDAPVLVLIGDQATNEDTPLTITLSASDVEGDELSYSAITENESVSVSVTGDSLTLSPTENYNGSVSVTVTVSDEFLSDDETFTLTVTPVNDPPNNFSLISPENNSTVVLNTLDDSTKFAWHSSFDVDGDSLLYKFVREAMVNSVSIDSLITDTNVDTNLFLSHQEMYNSFHDTLQAMGDSIVTFRWCAHAFDSTDSTTTDTFVIDFKFSQNLLSIDEIVGVPSLFSLHQNVPNPFNSITTLYYKLPENIFVTISVYNILGKQIKVLVNTTKEAGFRLVQWDATDSMGRPVSAGVYLYRIQAGEFVRTKKMVLLK